MAEEKKDWAPPRLRAILTKARLREVVWREIDLSKFDPELTEPNGEPQKIQVWANAPSGLMDYIRTADWSEDEFFAALAELTQYTGEQWRDLLDAWEGALKSWVTRQLFDVTREYQSERFNFLVSSQVDSTTNNSPMSESNPA